MELLFFPLPHFTIHFSLFVKCFLHLQGGEAASDFFSRECLFGLCGYLGHITCCKDTCRPEETTRQLPFPLMLPVLGPREFQYHFIWKENGCTGEMH